MNLLNKRGYNPIDDSSETGYRRPPRSPACVCDYFAVLGQDGNDDGKFMHNEMAIMLDSPKTFFGTVCTICDDENINCNVTHEEPEVSDCPGCDWECCGFCSPRWERAESMAILNAAGVKVVVHRKRS